MHSAFAALFLLSTPIHATITAKVWAHFYPNCPGDPYSTLDAYESYEETAPTKVITAGVCTSFGVPSFNHQLVSSISVDAELTPKDYQTLYPSDTGARCNITVHEEPECIDPALINQELHQGVEVSKCETRSFAAFSQIWIQLNCENDGEALHSNSLLGQSSNSTYESRLADSAGEDDVEAPSKMQTPGSNSNTWANAQTGRASQQNPEQVERVNQDGHAESEKIVHDLMERLKNQTATYVSGKSNSTRPVNGTLLQSNGTVSRSPGLIKRRLSVLRRRRTWA
ncbi:Uncharacterized protein PECH_007967 [Penicillium ucsense]|uniref:Ecp2 effector protein domain-containing protein n=1 Tax=Penicillium ucsense TaxID=2839758 RepID=A0A8J8W3M8_9EURO|nr:Uncharacterized protein PECM_004136 [Penicillium ucsense]KAF7734516.1 Uncharacterized protein PECH_007967 [Penicillium ucsense]